MKVSINIPKQTIHRLKEVQSILDQLHPEAEPQALIVPNSPAPHNNIIVFPGSFNPPTNAHLALMKQARQFAHSQIFSSSAREHHTTLLYAAMSKRTTDKENVERPLMLDRILLLDTLIRHRFRHTGIMLFNRGLYVEQAQAVRNCFPNVKRLCFLVGFDKIVQILDPRYYENRDAALFQLFALSELLVAPRGEANDDALSKLLEQPQNQPFAQHIHPLPFSTTYRDISSSRVRQHSDEHIQEVPQEVQRFMLETRAYAPPLRLADDTEINYYEERVKALEELIKSFY